MHSLLNDYLGRVFAQLWFMPRAHREDALREMRQHLTKLAADGQERGLAEKEAAQESLRHFGPPELVGRQMARTWWRGRLRLAASSAFGMTLLAGFLIPLPGIIIRLLMPDYVVSPGVTGVYVFPLPLTILWQMLIGLYVGRRLPRSPAVIIAVLMAASVASFLAYFVQYTANMLLATGSLPAYSNELAVVQSYAQPALYNLVPSALFLLPAAFAGRAWSKRSSA